MGFPVVTGAAAMCSFGMAPSTLAFINPTVLIDGMPAGTIPDIAPGMNIPPFGMCTSLANPTVATATAAALGVLTPMPCIPTVAGPWLPTAPTVLVGGKPVLHSDSKCFCAFGGVIQITLPGATKTMIG